MKFVIISAALLVCSVSASPFMFNSYQPMMNHFMSKMYPSHQYQQQSAAPTQVQVQPVQYHQAVQYQQAAAPVQYQQAPAQIQYRQAVAPVQYQQVQATPYQQVATPVQVQYQQAAPVQVAPVQFYYQSWPQVRQAPAEPTIIYIQRSKPEERANAGNINVTTHSTSSSVANANNNNVVQTPPPPPPPAPAAQSAPVSLQSVVVVHNPAPVVSARAPEAPAAASTRAADDAIVTSAAETTTVSAPAEAPTTLAPSAAGPSHDVVGVGALPVTLQSFVVLGGQQAPPTSVSGPSVITIQDEPSTVGQFESTSGPIYSTQPASTIIPSSVPVQGSTSSIQAGDTIFEHPC